MKVFHLIMCMICEIGLIGTASQTLAAHTFNNTYTGDNLNYIAFPLGGIGAGMICLEGTGAFSHFSIRNRPEVRNRPLMFAALSIKGEKNIAKVLEGPVPTYQIFGFSGSGNGNTANKHQGLPRFAKAVFESKFPFATINLSDETIPVDVEITGWSPFTPPDANESSLPVAALEYTFYNSSAKDIEATFSFNIENLMQKEKAKLFAIENGFTLSSIDSNEPIWKRGMFSVTVTDSNAFVDYVWFRGHWHDTMAFLWNNIEQGGTVANKPELISPGASIFVPFALKGGEKKIICVLLSWYVPNSDVKFGRQDEGRCSEDNVCKNEPNTYSPWYTTKFNDVNDVTKYWHQHYSALRKRSEEFRDCFYSMTLPPEVVEAVAANLSIMKSPTILRQSDGRLWAWEGCGDSFGCCGGSCTHVWNYAQAIPHLFPSLERKFRQTEFEEGQNSGGGQTARVCLPIVNSSGTAIADGQLGGIIKVYRDWRISGDSQWIKDMWPKVKKSLDFCIHNWDPNHLGVLVEPHHNTYDVEFWGPESMCSSIYLCALNAAIQIGSMLDDDVSLYQKLLKSGKYYLENKLYNGEYFYQKVQWQNLRNVYSTDSFSPEAKTLFLKHGPPWQYGSGCLSDGMIGEWFATVSGLEPVLDVKKIKSHLNSVYKYNFRKNLSSHANPQRAGFAMANDGGLLLCSWPQGGKPLFPFLYSDEVFTGIEYQVASHLIIERNVDKGLEIIRTCRKRYDGSIRNPFDEYECGHWYARAMASYALLQACSGIRYDAVEKVLYIRPAIKGDIISFLATNTGYGIAGIKKGKPFIEVRSGAIDVRRIDY